jgi:hypothetical protein
MTDQKMTVATRFAKRDKVATGKLLVWVQVKREDVMHLKIGFTTAANAPRIIFEVCGSQRGPPGRAPRHSRKIFRDGFDQAHSFILDTIVK